MSTKLHNHIQTHLDEYSGEFITTMGKPPVNAKLTNFKMYGKSVQSGTPTPETPVPIESVAHNTSITSCGKNLANWKRNWYDAFDGATSTNFRNEYDSVANCLNIKSNSARGHYPGILVRVKPNTNYTFSAKLVEVIDTNRVIIGVYKKGTGEYYDIVVKQSNYTSLTVGDVYNLEFDSGDTDIIMLVIAGNSGLLPGQILCKCDDIYLYEGGIDEYKDYISSTTQLNLIGAPNAPAEWIGQPISLMSLPDGTKDEYKADEGVVIKRIAKRVLNGGVSETYTRASYATWDRGYFKSFLCRELSIKFNNYTNHMLSPNFKSTTYPAGKDLEDNCIFAYGENNISFGFDIKIDSRLLEIDWDNSTDAQRFTAFRTWLASNNVEVVYDLNEPITIPVIPQPTPKSVYAQPNNIYADTTPQPTISCGVRKLGNRPFIPTNLKDELGNFLVDENGNNIGGLY